MADFKKKLKNKHTQDEYDAYLQEIKDKQEYLRKEKQKEKALAKQQENKLQKQMERDRRRKKLASYSTVAKTTQQTVPYNKVYDGGMFEIAKGIYSITFDLSDINYQISRVEEEERIFRRWSECTNYFGAGVDFSFTVNNRPVDAEKVLNRILLSPLDGLEEEIDAWNDMLKTQFINGGNDFEKERYFTVTIDANSEQEAYRKFNKIKMETSGLLKATGSEATIQQSERRMEILHDFFRAKHVGEFRIDWNEVKEQGLSSKDYIAPNSIKPYPKYMVMDKTYYRGIVLTAFGSEINDTIIRDLTDCDFPVMCTVSAKAYDTEDAVTMIRHKITSMETMMLKAQKKAVASGYDPELAVSTELKRVHDEAKEELAQIQSNSQKLFATTLTCVFQGNSLKELNENEDVIKSVARKHLCQLSVFEYQQEDIIKQTLPLGHHVLDFDISLITDSLAVMTPFTSMELNDIGGTYCSLNAITDNLIMVNRKKRMHNSNGFIFGESGTGKTFLLNKLLVAKYLACPDLYSFTIDPEGERSRIIRKLGGEVIEFGVGIDNYVNLFDMDINYSDGGDPVAEKVEFITAICEIMARGLTPTQEGIIDDVVRKLYAEYLIDYDKEKVPTLETFYYALEEENEEEAHKLALKIRIFAVGSLNIFAKKTNVDLQNRLISFNTSALKGKLRNVAEFVIFELIWNALCAHRNKVSTSIDIDEFHSMLASPRTVNATRNLFARVRKYGGEVTGITQNPDLLLQSADARDMISNAPFTIMLSQSETNRAILKDMFNLGEEQLAYITDTGKGVGLIRAGNAIVPFKDEFPKTNPMYRYMTSDPDEIKMFDAEDEQKKLRQEKQMQKKNMVVGVLPVRNGLYEPQ